jgi:hypothetical protein
MRIRLPQPPQALRESNKDAYDYLTVLVQALERAIERLPEQPFTRDRITVSNLTKQTTLDAAAGTAADVRAVLGTILVQLQESGKIS